jgi:hypothetical protein
MEQKTESYELATCTVVEALVKEELCVVQSSIHTCYSAQWKVPPPIPTSHGRWQLILCMSGIIQEQRGRGAFPDWRS